MGNRTSKKKTSDELLNKGLLFCVYLLYLVWQNYLMLEIAVLKANSTLSEQGKLNWNTTMVWNISLYSLEIRTLYVVSSKASSKRSDW